MYLENVLLPPIVNIMVTKAASIPSKVNEKEAIIPAIDVLLSLISRRRLGHLLTLQLYIR